MSVPEPLRHKGRLEVHVKGQHLASYTIKILSNEKIFTPDVDKELICRIKACAINIYAKTWSANKLNAETNAVNLKEGVMFLGFTFRLTDTGKVLMSIDPERVRAVRKKLSRLVKKAKKGELSRSKVDESYTSWRNHAAKGNSWNMLKRMDEYYNGLWGCNDAKDHTV